MNSETRNLKLYEYTKIKYCTKNKTQPAAIPIVKWSQLLLVAGDT